MEVGGVGGGGGGEGGGGEGGGKGGGDGGGGEGGGGEGGGEGGDLERGAEAEEAGRKPHCAGTPYMAVSEPDPPSWHAVLVARGPEAPHHIGGGGDEGGGGEGDGGGGDGGYLKRAPQSVQSVP